jgi:ubiquinone/menaquinone biosynthesis C-methylase UbiE
VKCIYVRPGVFRYHRGEEKAPEMNMGTGNFGKVREAYAASRTGVSQEVIDYFWSLVTDEKPRVLDIGCGTGISTRQLAARPAAAVVGSDIDQGMLEEARKLPQENIEYVLAPAHQLPFSDNEFDTVAAFSAFHWFRDEESINEIKRVLRVGKRFIVVNVNEVEGYRANFGEALERELNVRLLHPKRNYYPANILREAGFGDVRTVTWPQEEEFSLADAVRHIQSSGAWAQVPEEKEKVALGVIRQHILANKIGGRILRRTEVQAVSGLKV